MSFAGTFRETTTGRRPRGWGWIRVCLLVGIGCIMPVLPQNHQFGGSIRGYQFFSLQESPFLPRRDSELWLFRLTDESYFGSRVSFEFHGLMSFASPPAASRSGIAVSPSRKFLPLDATFYESSNLTLTGSLDRANIRVEAGPVEIKLGRQALSWGVSYFWPAMDLFAPFQPNQVDRDYKSGVDALRLTFALNNFSELEILGGILGSSARRDGAAGALLRWNVGPSDLGFMAGRFHGDTVGGIFVTANVRGTGLRGELTYTDSGDPEDVRRDRESFWRGSIGIDRQLIPSLGVVVELAWNGYGTADPRLYLDRILADRMLRGEVTALGRIHTGISANWMLHPLLNLNASFLINWNDSSTLWVPVLNWSAGDNAEVLVGGQISTGKGVGEKPGGDALLGSEYGIIPGSLFATIRIYF